MILVQSVTELLNLTAPPVLARNFSILAANARVIVPRIAIQKHRTIHASDAMALVRPAAALEQIHVKLAINIALLLLLLLVVVFAAVVIIEQLQVTVNSAMQHALELLVVALMIVA